MPTVHEAACDVPVAADVDLCVVGGSCTGVFAAVAAARQGLSAAVIEANGFFGGMATAALVNIWHSSLDTVFRKQVIGGLTMEIVDRLKRRGAVVDKGPSAHSHYNLNPAELVIELDELVREHAVLPFLHARFVKPLVHNGTVTAAVLEDKTGRRAVKARMFIDASGDGDLIARIPLECEKRTDLQPPTTTAWFSGIDGAAASAIRKLVFSGRFNDMIPLGFMWGTPVCGSPGVHMLAATRVPGADCSDADSLTGAEMEGRRQVRAILDIAREHIPECRNIALSALPASLGIRETRHAVCLHRLTEQEVLNGVRFDDAIANGSYRVDVHHTDKPGITFRYLDGREEYCVPGRPTVESRWRPETAENPTFYQIPYRSLVPLNSRNVLVAGRLIDADRGAYGAVRVMVNCNQTGEAAGSAAALALTDAVSVANVDTGKLRRVMADTGSFII
ncbi:MAG: FAD-dependent oxidoreductase [Planctomycetes bacterium]|nr:FAD-dependent oxidoreductase [Planctomycetota bacterium]